MGISSVLEKLRIFQPSAAAASPSPSSKKPRSAGLGSNDGAWCGTPSIAAERSIAATMKLAAARLDALRALTPTGTPWEGWRQFEIFQRTEEADQQASFYLRPTDGKAIPGFKPGQFLTVRVQVD